MPKPSGTSAAELLRKYISPEAPPVEDVRVLAAIIVGEGWAPDAVSRALAAEWRDRFVSKARQIHNDAASARSFITFTFSPASDSHIQGSCYALPDDPESIRADKKRRANALPMLEAVENLSHRDFEFLCGLVLAQFGVAEPNVSVGSGDQGVDFYGKAPFGKLIAKSTLPGSVEDPIDVWIIGQAKRYLETKVTTAHLRELVGSVELSRTKIHSAKEDPLKNLKVRLCDPVFYMMITSGRFTSGSRTLIERSGMIAMDGIQLCQFLADHGIAGGAAGFDADAFADAIEEIKERVLLIAGEDVHEIPGDD